MGGMKFGKDGDGNCGYYGADGSLIPFKGNIFSSMKLIKSNGATANYLQSQGLREVSVTFDAKKDTLYAYIGYVSNEDNNYINFSAKISDNTPKLHINNARWELLGFYIPNESKQVTITMGAQCQGTTYHRVFAYQLS